jgi:hypothetical protein
MGKVIYGDFGQHEPEEEDNSPLDLDGWGRIFSVQPQPKPQKRDYRTGPLDLENLPFDPAIEAMKSCGPVAVRTERDAEESE